MIPQSRRKTASDFMMRSGNRASQANCMFSSKAATALAFAMHANCQLAEPGRGLNEGQRLYPITPAKRDARRLPVVSDVALQADGLFFATNLSALRTKLDN
jgi:hypothetical protein